MAGRDQEPVPLRHAARAVRAASEQGQRLTRAVRTAGFPLRAPTVPNGVEPPATTKKVGADFETDWARRPLAKGTRRAIVNGPIRLAVRLVADPSRQGIDRLADLRHAEEPPAVVFAANHLSHVDAPLMLTSIPEPWRRNVVVAAAADYFFSTRVTSTMSALGLGAIPIERTRVNRRSADLAASLLDDGWSLLIFPEGGRSPDGWGQPFRAGAAYLSQRCGVPVIPVHLEGTGRVLGRGQTWPKPGRTIVTFGAPLWPDEAEDVRDYNLRIEQAVAALGDEATSDWYVARRRAASGTTPSLAGPEAGGWRRAWALSAQQRRGKEAEQRRRQEWPNL